MFATIPSSYCMNNNREILGEYEGQLSGSAPHRLQGDREGRPYPTRHRRATASYRVGAGLAPALGVVGRGPDGIGRSPTVPDDLDGIGRSLMAWGDPQGRSER